MSETEMSEAAAIIDEFKRLLDENATLTLTNVYKEVPIVHKGHICELRGERLILETDELQICAMHWSGNTVIQAPALTTPVEARVESSDIRRNQVTLSDFRTTEIPSKLRATVRVRLKKPARVTVVADAAGIAGVIHDISLGGCLIRTGRNNPGQVPVKVDIDLEGQRVMIPGRVVRIQGEEPCFECAVVFEHTAETEQTASIFIHKRELEIIKELQGAL